ncbi:metalloregulator ArsR/SmtB family transcription factor [Streptomyces sp. NPDC047002]|uniref:metalloregulator ArsR/SmtB family transcription factor n=1 Tax=Streptomyces sp. NPDC047002 TaxID=3155475 RepID=UPI0034556CFD
MHLVPPERADHRIIDGHLVCDAIAAVGDPGAVRAAAARFSLLAEPGRLALLLALRAVGPMAVSDLAVTTGMRDPAVSQALRLLRSAGAVAGEKDGRIVRYRVVDAELGALLDRARGAATGPVEPAEPAGPPHADARAAAH